MTSLLVLRRLINQRSKITNLLSTQIRYYAQPTKRSELTTSSGSRNEISADVKPLGERVKENTKTASYMGIIMLGVGVTGIMFYAIMSELFSSTSANTIYSNALDRCVNEKSIQDALGAPIKGYGEETRRRRRNHVAHTLYQRDGVNFMRMMFHIQGIRNKGTVNLEMRENSNGKYEYRYLFVELDHYPKRTIILEDNRLRDPISGQELKGFT